ncbi:DNA-binding protein [uncultured Alistipes sp.]|uniref:DNA-binding protein n=1 Tax=uncultured Alistipes sp. TaxID=538949 RepID=UPI002805B6D2|nr:DNA-binding protein [uncultured Alistipes sp.]
MADKIILTSREELEGYIYAAVRSIVPELAKYKVPAEDAADALTVEAAICFLEGLGYPTTPSNLYNLAYYRKIPFKKVRRRLVFSRRELSIWVQSQIQDPNIMKENSALHIAESANRK